ncbi:MAG: aldehyde dehydrogenase family protein [Phycisphaeraceae bacterium]|nr:aldehyde dehydrogenase family protein [Phycisphaeraceae bacterium]
MDMPAPPGSNLAPADLIAGRWVPLTGDAIVKHNPARPSTVMWAADPVPAHVEQAVNAARAAFSIWSRWPPERRMEVLRTYQRLCRERADAVADRIADETGKVLWDSRQEAGALASKVDITLESGANTGMSRVASFELDLAPSRIGRCWFRPHGVMAVIAPFNFPAHLPNGHMVPALAMGNTVVLKPSDKAPGVGQMLVQLFHDALQAHDAPPGVVNLVHGAGDIASRLVSHEGVDGVLFTGSWPVGRRILEANLDRPGRIIALEMGGNNAAVVMPDADVRQAVIECARSAFVTTGQRCTCTRRVVVHRDIADRFVPALLKVTSNLLVGDPRSDAPVFMGPIISEEARELVHQAQDGFARAGGEVLLESTSVDSPEGGWYLTPGVVRVDRFVPHDASDAGCDAEVFGPLLRFSIVDSLEEAISQANATRFGLAASIFTRDHAAAEEFLATARAGCINVNAGTAGASSRLPFGGLGHSGNHRPAGSFSLDYCAFPVAGMIEQGDAASVPTGMRVEDAWVI